MGGAAPAAEGARLALWDGGSLVGGLASLPRSAFDAPTAKGMQTGGFFAWQSESYRVDATIVPSLVGNVVAGLGAATGARSGEAGTSYAVRLGAAWSGNALPSIRPAALVWPK